MLKWSRWSRGGTFDRLCPVQFVWAQFSVTQWEWAQLVACLNMCPWLATNSGCSPVFRLKSAWINSGTRYWKQEKWRHEGWMVCCRHRGLWRLVFPELLATLLFNKTELQMVFLLCWSWGNFLNFLVRGGRGGGEGGLLREVTHLIGTARQWYG